MQERRKYIELAKNLGGYGKIKKHTYDPKVAQKVGLEGAVLLFALDILIESEQIPTTILSGEYYGAISAITLQEDLPYFTVKNIQTLLNSLKNDGYLDYKGAVDYTIDFIWCKPSTKYFKIMNEEE